MTVQGRFIIDTIFQDTSDATTESTTKVLKLQEAGLYEGGKVALETGTVGTGTITINTSTLEYKNAAGVTPTFSSFSRIAFVSNGTTRVFVDDQNDIRVAASRSDNVAIALSPTDSFNTLKIYKEASGTADVSTYTVMIYGL